jgi:hypothetical protein
VHAYTRIPLLSPRVRDTEVFVVHPQVARFVRHENAAFLSERVAALREHEAAYFAELERLAAIQLDETMTRLAPALPRYRVSFLGDGFEVLGPEAQSIPAPVDADDVMLQWGADGPSRSDER